MTLQAFARRALSKINELSQLEYMSNAKQSIEVERTFRLATVKVSRYLSAASIGQLCCTMIGSTFFVCIVLADDLENMIRDR